MKQQPSAIAMTSLSGHSGGTTATITNIVRRKSNPRQPRTPAQTAARALLASLSTSWGGLTEAQQDAWIAAAPNYLVTKNGVSTPLKGNTAYVRANSNLSISGNALITTPVAPVAFPIMGPTNPGLTYSIGDEAYYYTLGFDSAPDITGFTMMGVASPWIPAINSTVDNPIIGGRRNLNNTVRELGPIDYEEGFVDFSENYLKVFPAWPLTEPNLNGTVHGSVIVGYYLVSNTTGQATKKILFRALCITGG